MLSGLKCRARYNASMQLHTIIACAEEFRWVLSLSELKEVKETSVLDVDMVVKVPGPYTRAQESYHWQMQVTAPSRKENRSHKKDDLCPPLS